MSVALNPYLSFRGSAREAMEFYRTVLGGELTLSTFGEGMGSDDPAEKDLVMHGHLAAEGGLTFMGSDVPPRMEFGGQSGVALSLSGTAEDEARLRGCFDALADGGTVEQPLVAAPWGASFGMLTDRFGTSWMVNIEGASQA